jgi:hypothetical protein
VAVANIRAAQGAGGALLMWGGAASGVDVSGELTPALPKHEYRLAQLS